MAGLKAFGLYFAKLRETSGYRSQRELAEKSGISHSTINRIEAGTNRANPATLKAVSPYLKNVTYEELLSEAGIVTLRHLRFSNSADSTDEDAREFYDNIDLADEDIMKKFPMELDGRKVTEEEYKWFIASVRAKRSME